MSDSTTTTTTAVDTTTSTTDHKAAQASTEKKSSTDTQQQQQPQTPSATTTSASKTEPTTKPTTETTSQNPKASAASSYNNYQTASSSSTQQSSSSTSTQPTSTTSSYLNTSSTYRPPSRPAHSVENKVFLGGLSPYTNEARLIQFFSQYGVVTEVSIVLDRLTGQSRGFGFVAFSKREPMLALLTPGVVLELDGRRLQVRAAVHRDQLAKTSADEDSAKLFVGGLAATVDDRVLSHHFSQYGRVTYCTIMLDRLTGASRGFGFVTFASPAEAIHALHQSEGTEIAGRRLKVTMAAPKGSRPPKHHVAVAASPYAAAAGATATATSTNMYGYQGNPYLQYQTPQTQPSAPTYASGLRYPPSGGY